MSIGTSLVLVAVGAILAFAVDVHASIANTTIHWHTVGWILIVVGAIGIVLSLFWMASNRRRTTVADDEYVERRPV